MAMVDTLERRESDTPAGAAPRQVGRRRALPNGRAVVGALLITVSVFGVFWSWSAATRPPTTAYVAAARDLVVGDIIEGRDLRLVVAELPGALSESAFTGLDELIGSVVVGPVRRGELVQAGAVARRLGGPQLREISFAIEGYRALAGRLQPGQRVDVLATFGAGGQTYTTVVVRSVVVLRIERPGRALGGGDQLTVTVGLEPADDALALAHALNVGDVFLIESTTPPGSDGPPSEPVYRAPGAGAEADR